MEKMRTEQLKELIEAVDSLTPKEQKVLKLKFGLDDGKVRAIDEVANELNETKEVISEIEVGALRKLRHPKQ